MMGRDASLLKISDEYDYDREYNFMPLLFEHKYKVLLATKSRLTHIQMLDYLIALNKYYVKNKYTDDTDCIYDDREDRGRRLLRVGEAIEFVENSDEDDIFISLSSSD